MKLVLIITNDWELYGNGKGDYYKIQKQPLNSILEVLEKYNAKLTVFAEVMQQINAINEASNDAYFKEVSDDWVKTARDLIGIGHDIQLHIHPQLYEGNNNWSIAGLQAEQMDKIISLGKTYLEQVLREVDKQYRCIAFRAGGYAIQPSATVVHNLLKNEIKCDSSVTKGLYGSYYDFRKAYSHFFPWFCNSDICSKSEQNNGFLEIPIFSIPVIDSPVLRKLLPKIYYRYILHEKLANNDINWLKQLRNHDNTGYSIKDKYSLQAGHSFIRLIVSKMLQRSSLQFDYDKVPSSIMVKMIQKTWTEINSFPETQPDRFEHCYLPIVLIGHTKELKSTSNIDRLLKQFTNTFPGTSTFMTISEFYNHYLSYTSEYTALENRLKQSGLFV